MVDGSDIIINNRSFPLSNVPLMRFGSMPRDGGNFIFTEPEKEEFLKLEPKAEKWIRTYTGAQEFINGYSRYCLWLVNIQPQELKKSKEIYRRVEEVRKVRSESNRKTTQELSKFPTLFGENRQPDTNYLLIPGVSSENRKYIPTGFLSPDIITSNSCLIIPYATLYHPIYTYILVYRIYYLPCFIFDFSSKIYLSP